MLEDSFVVYDFDPYNLPKELLQAIGLMVAATAQTENIVQQFIGTILGIDDIETLAVALHMSSPLKSNVAKTLMELNGASIEIVDEVDDLLDAIDASFEKRNVIVHNNFMRNPNTGEIFSYRVRARGSLKSERTPVDVRQIEETAAEVYEAGLNLMRFMQAHNLAPAHRTRPTLPIFDRRKSARQKRRGTQSSE